ncbi:3-oxoadipate enol-lactonase [Clostridia bacterium]|nr:3-oxoadipate enol-lactonase [Clostridia bacterium]
MKQYQVFSESIPCGETIAWREAGYGRKAVVLLHGNMSSSVHWQTTIEALEDKYWVYAPDMRGFGDSSYNQPFDSLHELALDIEEFIDQRGIDRFTVLGWSTGGGVAMEIAADLKDRVEKVILLDSVALTGYPMFQKDERGMPIPGKSLQTKAEVAADPVQVLPILKAYAEGNREMLRSTWNMLIYNLRQPSAEDYEIYLDAIMKQRNLVDVDWSLLTFNMTNLSTPSAPGSNRAQLITCPVVIIQGGKDLVVPPAWAQNTAEYLGDRAKLIMIENAGHSAITDDFDTYIRIILNELS